MCKQIANKMQTDLQTKRYQKDTHQINERIYITQNKRVTI